MKKIALLLVLSALVLTSCGGALSERERFVAASVDIGCQLLEDPTMHDDMTAVLELTYSAFLEYGFDVEDEAYMTTLSETYQYDENITQDIQKGLIDQCSDLLLPS